MMNRCNSTFCFVRNNHAVLGLPMQLTVSLIIGTIALIAIVSFILNPCLFPQKMTVSATPMVLTIPGNEPVNVSCNVSVQETNGHALSGAIVIVKGLGGAGSGITNTTGITTITLQVRLEPGVYEGYLDVCVSNPCHERFEQLDMIKVVKLS
jgi:hypothetical protein